MRKQKQILTLMILSLIGLFFYAVIRQSEYYTWPKSLETPGHMCYRLVYFLVLPFRSIVYIFIKRVNHHWPFSHTFISSIGAPFFIYLLWRIFNLLFYKLTGNTFFKSSKYSPDKNDHERTGQANSDHDEKINIERRVFLGRCVVGSTGTLGAGFISYSAFIEPDNLKIREYAVNIKDLPDDLDGLKIIHVSDTHYGPYVPMPYLERVAQIVNDLKGDLIVFTGDYIHWTPKSIEPGIGLLGKMNARFGSVAVLGNHEHWEGADKCREIFKKINVPLVDNHRCFLGTKGISKSMPSRQCICIAGLGDLWEDRVLIKQAFKGVPNTMPRLLLTHNPDTAEQIKAGVRVDLMFCGHTHGGQVSIPFLGPPVVPIRFKSKYTGGLCKGPICPVIVSRGVGLAGFPLRFRVPPEVGMVILKPL